MSCTANQMVSKIKSWIGKKESNGTHKSIIDIYNKISPLPRGYKVKYSDNWCATTISAAAKECGALDIIPAECSCGQMIELMKKKGIWIENDNISPKVGDIIFYDWDKKDGWPEHVGIVEKVYGNTITAIEGNKGNAVARRSITVGSASIRGYGRPKYKAESKPSKPSTSTKKIAEDGQWGKDTTKLSQKVFGTPVDGIVSNQYKAYASKNKGLLSSTFEWETTPGKSGSSLIKAIQKKVGVKADGFIGPSTIKAMQKWLGTVQDGNVSNPSTMVKAFQKWLNKQ